MNKIVKKMSKYENFIWLIFKQQKMWEKGRNLDILFRNDVDSYIKVIWFNTSH